MLLTKMRGYCKVNYLTADGVFIWLLLLINSGSRRHGYSQTEVSSVGLGVS